MRMCIVGNGPSAKEYAREIDTCDFVVRMNAWPPGMFGKKWDVWASSFSPWSHMQPEAIRYKLFDIMPKNLQTWFIGSPQSKWGYVKYKKGSKTVTFSPPGWKPRAMPCSSIGPDIGRWIKSYINTLGNSRRFGPSTGLQVLGYALTRQPDELVLVGFDATAEGKPGWGDAWNPRFGPAASVGHSFATEKRAIQEWLKTRRFCGRAFPKTRPLWWRLKKYVPMPVVRAVRTSAKNGVSFDIQLQQDAKWTHIGRFSVAADGEVSIFMEEPWRGKHLSADLVFAGTKAIENAAPRLNLKAYVALAHATAQRAFERAGWLGRDRKKGGQRPRRLVKRGGATFIKYMPDPRFWRAAGQRRPKSRNRRREFGRRARGLPWMNATRQHGTPKTVAVPSANFMPGRHRHSAGAPERVSLPGTHARVRAKAAAAQKKKRSRRKR